ncbi:hypothetical protein GCM10009819_07400 [Agromyces tropicus]|uniref:alpha-L-rhamnosidase n=1 Tax=Agromyces tropicus TaxID=555371 RepID=A0ABP5FHI9_9MICO
MMHSKTGPVSSLGPPIDPTRRGIRRSRLAAPVIAAALAVGLAVPVTAAQAAPAGKLDVSGLTAEHMTNPLGLDETAPRLGWIVGADYNGARQTAYEIRVSSANDNSGDVWSSGKVTSDQSYDVEYGGPDLDSRTRYYWSVRVWDDSGKSSPSAWSDRAWFETAFLDSDEFEGEWIGRTDVRPASETPEALLRKEFDLDNNGIRSARLYIAGLGLHKVYLNGERVGDHELDPAYTPYDQRVLYVTHDVTDLLEKGENAIGVSLGRGWYSAYGESDITRAAWLSEPELKLELDVTYANGETERIVSDGSWTADDGPTLKNASKFGETYDARLEQPGWATADFDDAGWDAAVLTTGPTGRLDAQDTEPIRVVGTLGEPEISAVNDTTTLYDFRTTEAGWATVDVSGPAGAQVVIKYGEKLKADGTVNDTWGNSGALQTYTYTLKGDGVESYTPSYSYAGYRFVQITKPDSVEVHDVVGKELNTDVAKTGGWSSSNELLNRYHDAMVKSTLNNLHGIPTDTPMYEKRGWTADAHLIVESALRNLGTESFWEKWMLDHKYNQGADGGLQTFIPHQTKGGEDVVWSASYVFVNHALYWERGDIRTLELNYDGMKKWLEKWMTTAAGTGYIVTSRTWGDHEPAYGGGMNNRIVSTAFLYEGAQKMTEIAEVLGHDDDAEAFAAFGAQVRDAFNAEYFDESTATYDFPYAGGGFGPAPTPEEIVQINANQFQTDNVLPLELGLVPDEYRDQLCENLIEDVVVTQDNHVTTGATVLSDVLPNLTECGGAEAAFDAAVNPTFPGWGFWFLTLDGSTGLGGEEIIVDTHWEAWYEGARSHDHAFRGTIDDWFYEYVSGLTATAPAYREVQVKPYVVGDLTTASATTTTPLGELSSSWEIVDGRFVLKVSVPVGSSGTVLVPVQAGAAVEQTGGASASGVEDGYAAFEVGSGEYTFTTAH